MIILYSWWRPPKCITSERGVSQHRLFLLMVPTLFESPVLLWWEKASNSGMEAYPASVILAGENVGLLILEEEKALMV
ncbi:hypothetical protein AB3S75_026371 [Citrus x aurantiifolia]